MRERAGRTLILWIVGGLLATAGVSQTPFVTDDAQVTAVKQVHFEAVTEYDLLQSALFPATRQLSGLFRLSTGVNNKIEVGLDVPVLTVLNAAGTSPSSAAGLSDIAIHVKVKVHEERENSHLPALAVTFYARFPTGSAARSLGSGVRNYWLYGVGQKSITKKTALRVNAGGLFAGNTVFGVLGVSKYTGHLFTASASLIKRYNDKWRFGGEVASVLSTSFQLSKGQLQAMAGGSYNVRKHIGLDLGFVVGRFPASPKFGLVGGITIDR